MKCDEIRERMPEVAAGFSEPTVDESKHLEGCGACVEQLKEMRSTMALLDEWQVPEPSPYFDVRLQARLREEMAKPQAGWLHLSKNARFSASLDINKTEKSTEYLPDTPQRLYLHNAHIMMADAVPSIVGSLLE